MVTTFEELGIADDDEVIAGTEGAIPPGDVAETQPVASRSVSETLARVGLMAELTQVQLDRLAGLCDEVRVAQGDHVFRHGDEGDGLYIVLDGVVRISRDMAGMGEEALAILRPGEYFGEMSLLDDGVRSADAICQNSARLLRLPRHALNELMWTDQEFGYELLWRFVRALCARLRQSNDRLTLLATSSKF
ncbi:MAG: cyclic nucleotide-binding domain-containing protein [Nannocystaceae bacterium]